MKNNRGRFVCQRIDFAGQSVVLLVMLLLLAVPALHPRAEESGKDLSATDDRDGDARYDRAFDMCSGGRVEGVREGLTGELRCRGLSERDRDEHEEARREAPTEAPRKVKAHLHSS